MNKAIWGKITRMFYNGDDMMGIMDQMYADLPEEQFEELDAWYKALNDLDSLEKVVMDKAKRGPCVHDGVQWVRELEQIRRVKQAMAKVVGVNL